MRVLRPAVEIEVTTGSPDGGVTPPPAESGVAPMRLRAVKSRPGASPEIAGAVRVAAGPWSMEEGWWTGTPAARDYWDVELSEGGLYRIYRDRSSETWYADGVYD